MCQVQTFMSILLACSRFLRSYSGVFPRRGRLACIPASSFTHVQCLLTSIPHHEGKVRMPILNTRLPDQCQRSPLKIAVPNPQCSPGIFLSLVKARFQNPISSAGSTPLVTTPYPASWLTQPPLQYSILPKALLLGQSFLDILYGEVSPVPNWDTPTMHQEERCECMLTGYDPGAHSNKDSYITCISNMHGKVS